MLLVVVPTLILTTITEWSLYLIFTLYNLVGRQAYLIDVQRYQ